MAASNAVRIRLRYPDLDTFVEKFAPNVTRGGIFLASRNVQPVDQVISFEIQLTGGEVVMAGQGRVTWVKEFNAAEPHRPYGMGVQFISVDGATKPVLARILRAREAGGVRRATGSHAPVGRAGGTAPHAALEARAAVNGKPAAPPVDTSVDLAAEYGLPEAVVRRIIDRSGGGGVRGGVRGDDLGELLKTEPPEVPTLAQALAELPRLLDPQNSRRRTGSYRPTEVVGTVAPPRTNDNASLEKTQSPLLVEAPETTEHSVARDTSESIDVVFDDRSAAAPLAESNGHK